MKVKDVLTLLAPADPEAEVVINLSGSIYPTASMQENQDYNDGNDTNEYYIVGNETF